MRFKDICLDNDAKNGIFIIHFLNGNDIIRVMLNRDRKVSESIETENTDIEKKLV